MNFKTTKAALLALGLIGSLVFESCCAGDGPLTTAGVPPPNRFASGQAQLDPLPHELHPDDWPQPDYFTEALKLTRFQAGERFKTLRLAPGVEPDLLVLPVQMQVFGWTPSFAAIVGAKLDHELQSRGFNANRQTDLFDLDGPYVRRFDERQIAAFAAEHPRARVVALYLGRDADGKDFVTLTLGRGAESKRSHRTIVEKSLPAPALEALTSVLPAMLSELGLTGAPRAATETPARCEATAWNLDDLKSTSTRGARACQALVMGTLLPELEWPTIHSQRPKSPAKLAWLAQAYVEADALARASAAAVSLIAWIQLELADTNDSARFVIDVDDPVARPLARLVWAWERGRSLPVRSQDESVQAYLAEEAAALPPFAQAVFMERGSFQEQFRRVDTCALEVLVPSMRMPPECAGRKPGPATSGRAASRGEQSLLDEWRLARSYKDLRIQGRERGDPAARQRVLTTLSARIAGHPFLRHERFGSEKFDTATGAYSSLVKRAELAVTDFVQATADVQRATTEVQTNALVYKRWTSNEALVAEPAIASVVNDDMRLTRILELDGFAWRGSPLSPRMTVHWNYLRPGTMVAINALPPSVAASAASSARVAMPSPGSAPAFPRRLALEGVPFFWRDGNRASTADLEKAVAHDAQDMEARVALAVRRLKEGETVLRVRALVDERAADVRFDRAITESHDWSLPAHAFWFSGEVDAARSYYERVARIGTGSSSDMLARVRLRLFAGDIEGSAKATRERLSRYEGDFGRRDLAGFEFMLGHSERGWSALRPRLPQSAEMELWVGASVGHRIQGMTARRVRDWISESDFGHARVGGSDIRSAFLFHYILDDRLPADDDIALLREMDPQPSAQTALRDAAMKLKRLALSSNMDEASLQAVRDGLLKTTNFSQRGLLKPLYAFVAWHVHAEKDHDLTDLRSASLDADLDSLLATATLLGLESRPEQAMAYLRAARFELSQLSTQALNQDLQPAPYSVALTSYLLFSSTKNALYRDEALKMAHAYQRIFPFLAWPYALDALLSPPGPARNVAACRAQFLDRESLFLKLSGLTPKADDAACHRALWKAR